MKEEQQHFLFAVCSYAKGDQNFITDRMCSKNLVISKFKFIVNIYITVFILIYRTFTFNWEYMNLKQNLGIQGFIKIKRSLKMVTCTLISKDSIIEI